MPKVSVIIPCYNQEDYLEDALKSLKGDFKDFEVIVVNDGSTNVDAFEKIQSICDKFTEFSIKLINQENQGVCVARNNAIKMSIGEYVFPLDADDMIKNEYLEKASEVLDNNPQIGIVYSYAEFCGEKTGFWKLADASIINMLSQNRIFNSAMYRKSDFEKVGGYNTIMKSGCEDWDLWLSMMGIGLKAYCIRENYFTYRILPFSREKNALAFKNYLDVRKNIVLNHKKLYLKYNLLVLIPLGLRIIQKGLLCRR